MRNSSSVSKKSLDQEPRMSDSPGPRDARSPGHDLSHDPLSSAFEASMSSLVEEEALPLPPPPRVASVTSLNTAEDIDLLPPPPPDMCLTEVSSHYLVSPVSGPGPALARLPPPAPAPKPGTQNKPSVIQSSSSVTLTDQGQESSSAPRLSAQFSRKLSLDERKYRYTHKYFLT